MRRRVQYLSTLYRGSKNLTMNGEPYNPVGEVGAKEMMDLFIWMPAQLLKKYRAVSDFLDGAKESSSPTPSSNEN